MRGADDIRRRIEELEREAAKHEALAREDMRRLAGELSEYAESGNLYGFLHAMDGSPCSSVKSHLGIRSDALRQADALRFVLRG